MPSTAIREVAVLKVQHNCCQINFQKQRKANTFYFYTLTCPVLNCRQQIIRTWWNCAGLNCITVSNEATKLLCWDLPLRLDVACSPGRLHLIFEFVDSNLKQPESQHSWRSVTATRVSVTSQYDFAQSQMISGACNDCTLMYIGNPKVHEEIWASTGSRSCAIPRKHT